MCDGFYPKLKYVIFIANNLYSFVTDLLKENYFAESDFFNLKFCAKKCVKNC